MTAKCGTPAAYLAHIRANEKPDGACKQARAEYMREYRRKNRAKYLKQRDLQNAYGRALTRLARAYPREFRRLVLDEQAKAERHAFSSRTVREFHNSELT